MIPVFGVGAVHVAIDLMMTFEGIITSDWQEFVSLPWSYFEK